MNLGTSELLILAVIVVLVFGAGWLPKAARNLGRAKVEVDKAQKQFADTKAQVIEATGVEKAEQAFKKANRTLNQSPQSLLKGAAASAIKPTTDSSEAEALVSEAPATDTPAEAASNEAADSGSDLGRDSGETRNIDFTTD